MCKMEFVWQNYFTRITKVVPRSYALHTGNCVEVFLSYMESFPYKITEILTTVSYETQDTEIQCNKCAFGTKS